MERCPAFIRQSGRHFLMLHLCFFFKVPAEEADILSKLLAEVASLPNVVQEPAAAKVSGGMLCCPEFCSRVNKKPLI